MSWVDPGSGFRNIKDLACLVGEYLQVVSCPVVFSATQGFWRFSTTSMVRACHRVRIAVEDVDLWALAGAVTPRPAH